MVEGNCENPISSFGSVQGNKHNRLDGEEHMAVVEEFVNAAKDKWPHCLIQFEDFPTDKAFAILDRFRDKCLCFNGVHIVCCPYCLFWLPLLVILAK